METPFLNDMFSLVHTAFQNLYPGKDISCQWVAGLEPDEEGREFYGITTFYTDGGTPEIKIVVTQSVIDAVETLAHELAHVAVGNDEGHSEKWESAYEAIRAEYNRLGDEMIDTHTPVRTEDCED